MPTPLYHITHFDNLASVVAEGLLCDRAMAERDIDFHSIAYSEIKAIRARTDVLCDPGGTLVDYVPFYFAPRSPMLFTINQGNVASVTDRQTNILHLVFRAEDLVANQDCVFTDGHAIIALSNFYNDFENLSRLDWDSINSNRWGSYYDATDETKRKKQAEFLAHGHVPWERVRGIGVPSAVCAGRVVEVLDGVAHRPRVVVKQDWYY